VKKKVFRLLGYLFSVFPPLAATLACFPPLYARGDGERAVSLGAVLLLALSLLPILRRLRVILRTPSAPLLWGILLAVFYVAHRVAAEVVFISCFGLVGSLLGALFFRLGKARRGGEAYDRA
jgi:hypothetical protein